MIRMHYILYLPIVAVLFFHLKINSQTPEENIGLTPDYALINQNATSAEKPGVYSQVITPSKTILSPNDTFEIRYFITGYGLIDYKSSKLQYIFPPELLDKNNSHLYVGLRSKGDTIVVWGAEKSPLQNTTVVFMNSTLFRFGKSMMTSFDDLFIPQQSRTKMEDVEYEPVLSKNHPIRSEMHSGNDGQFKDQSPIFIKAKLKDNVMPGTYYLYFTFTYFNGEKWLNDKVEIPITIQNWYERNENYIQLVAQIIAFLTLILLPAELINIFRNWFMKKEAVANLADGLEKPNVNSSSPTIDAKKKESIKAGDIIKYLKKLRKKKKSK